MSNDRSLVFLPGPKKRLQNSKTTNHSVSGTQINLTVGVKLGFRKNCEYLINIFSTSR